MSLDGGNAEAWARVDLRSCTPSESKRPPEPLFAATEVMEGVERGAKLAERLERALAT